MDEVNELKSLKARIEQLKSEYDMAVGKVQSIKADIEAEGFSSISALKAAIEATQVELDKSDADINQGIIDWKEKYGDLL